MLRTILIALACAAVSFSAAAEPTGVGLTNTTIDTTAEALELHYISRKIYSPVRCLSKRVGYDAFVRCVPAPFDRQGPAGGLFIVKAEAGVPHVAPVNGKARTHIEGASLLQSATGNPVTVGDVMRPSPDIPAILNAF